MANVDHPHGLVPVMSRFKDTPRMTQYKAFVNTTTPVAIFRGDVVELLATGDVQSVTVTGQVTTALGVAANYIPALAANDQADVWVYDDPDIIYEVQSDGTTDPATVAAAQAHIGQTAVIALTAGTASSGQSGFELDYGNLGTDTTAPLKVVGLYDLVGNDVTLAHGAARVPVVASRTVYGELPGWWNEKHAGVAPVQEHDYGVTVATVESLACTLERMLGDKRIVEGARKAIAWQAEVWRSHSYEMQAGHWLELAKEVTGESGAD